MVVKIILTAFLVIIIIIGYIGMQCANNRLKKDPHYQKKLAERQTEERRRKTAEKELAESMEESGYDYY